MNDKVESGIELSEGMKVFFVGEKLPMEVKAVSKNFAICTRKLHRREDAGVLHHQVEMSAYFSFTEAYNDQKDDVVYTIIDFRNNIRGAHNLSIGGFDFKESDSLKECLADLECGEIEISYRNRCDYKLDFERTLNQ